MIIYYTKKEEYLGCTNYKERLDYFKELNAMRDNYVFLACFLDGEIRYLIFNDKEIKLSHKKNGEYKYFCTIVAKGKNYKVDFED